MLNHQKNKKMNKKIYILLDYDNRFYSEWDKNEFNLNRFIELLCDDGFEVELLKFSEINFQKINFNNKIILYSSCEVGEYKNYIEDVLLGIVKQGGILIPNFYLFRAHHNKSFQEIYKKILNFGNLEGRSFGSFKEFLDNLQNVEFPLVLKIPNGSGSKKIYLPKNYQEAKRIAKRISSSFDSIIKKIYFSTRATIAYLMGIRDKERIYRNNTKKFVAQKYIPNLKNDWKVLIYGEHYYALKRGIRKNDFRASGSHNFVYVDPPNELLDFCEKIFKKLKTPYLSLDVAIKKNKCYLLEFQALYFGMYTILHANSYYKKEKNIWIKKIKKNSVEKEMVKSILKFTNDNIEKK